MPVYHLDPWQDIVGVGWGNAIAYLSFNFSWGGGVGASGNYSSDPMGSDPIWCSSPYSWPPPTGGFRTQWTEQVRYTLLTVLNPTVVPSFTQAGVELGAVNVSIAGRPAAGDVNVTAKSYTSFLGRRMVPSGSTSHPRATWSTGALASGWKTTTSYSAETALQKISERSECFYEDTGSSDPLLGWRYLEDDPLVLPGDPNTWTWIAPHPSDFSGLTATVTISGTPTTFVCTGSSYLTGASGVRLLLERQDLVP
jgi:hypothetical protein